MGGELSAAETEVAWFAHELLPELRSTGSHSRVVGGWKVGAPRVTAVEGHLTVLTSSAPTDQDSQRATELGEGVRAARERMDALTGAGTHDEWPWTSTRWGPGWPPCCPRCRHHRCPDGGSPRSGEGRPRRHCETQSLGPSVVEVAGAADPALAPRAPVERRWP